MTKFHVSKKRAGLLFPLFLAVIPALFPSCLQEMKAFASDREASFAPLPLVPKAAEDNEAGKADSQNSSAVSEPAVAFPVDLGKPVETGKLGEVEPDSVGILSPQEGGFGAGMWENTPRWLVEKLMEETPLPVSSPVINGLARRLLLSAAAPPQGEGAAKRSFVSLRLEKLLALGDVSGAWRLAMLAKPGRVDENVMRLLTEAALIGPDSKALCERVPEFIAGRDSTEWQKALMLCQLRAGDTKAVQLGLDLMREQQVRDDIFITIMNRAMLGERKRLPRQLTPLRPLVLGLLRQMDLPLPPDIYAKPDAFLIPELLLADAEDDGMRLILAEKSAAKGIISGAQLAAVYRDIKFSPEALANVSVSNETGPKLHALLFQAAAEEKDPAKRAAIIYRFMSSADPLLFCGSGGQALAELASSVPASAESGVSSVALARLMAFAAKPEKALEWLNLARSMAANDQNLAAQLMAGWPLFVLSGIVTDAEYGAGLKVWIEWLLGGAGGDAAAERARLQQAATVLTMLSAAGYAVPEQAWMRVAGAMTETRRTPVPPAIMLERLRNAGANNRRGETVLLIIALAGMSSGETPLFVAAEAVRSLRLAGLKAEAFSLAREVVASALGSAAGQ